MEVLISQKGLSVSLQILTIKKGHLLVHYTILQLLLNYTAFAHFHQIQVLYRCIENPKRDKMLHPLGQARQSGSALAA